MKIAADPELLHLERDLEGLMAIEHSSEYDSACIAVMVYRTVPNLDNLRFAMRRVSEAYEVLKQYSGVLK